LSPKFTSGFSGGESCCLTGRVGLAYPYAWWQLTNEWTRLIEDYLTGLVAAGRSASSVKLRREQLAHLARGLDCPPGAVTEQGLLGWFAGQSWARETRRSYRAAARGFFGWAAGAGHIGDDPAAGLPVVSQRAGVPRPVPDEAYAVALAAGSARAVLMMRLAAEAGLRRGEIARVHSGDLVVGVAGFSLVVRGKGDKDRMIPLGDDLGAEIKAADGWLFPRAGGGHVSPAWVGELCANVLPGGFTLHGLRHRFATRAYAASRDLRAVQLLLGHSSPVVTQRYVAVEDGALRAAMDAAS
jgi:integrase/recombinase XerC